MYEGDALPTTLGAEFESVISTKDSMLKEMRHLSEKSFIKSVTRDASVESLVYPIGNESGVFVGSTLLKNLAKSGHTTVAGYEVVTQPLVMKDMREAMFKIISAQVKMGEIFSERSSIHIHTGFPQGFVFAKMAVALGLKLEPLFFKIAGMGNEYRGSINNSAYCRALALPPVIVLEDTEELVRMDPAGCLECNNPYDFWGKLGIRYGDTERYNPLRYLGVNIYSTALRGTIEYRFFNYCSVSKFVEAVASMCQLVSNLMIRMPMKAAMDLPDVSIFTKNSDDDYNYLLDAILWSGKFFNCDSSMEDRDIDAIRELISITPQPVFTAGRNIRSHVKVSRINSKDAEKFELDYVDRAEEPGITDIHNFLSSNRSLMGDTCVS